MIDIHTHLIPNVDDGSKNIEDTIGIISEAQKAGFTDIILTPHFIQDYCERKITELIEQKEIIQKELEKKSIQIKLHLGMEIYVSDELEKLLKNNQLLSLANSKYMLIELPISTQINYLDYIVSKLKTNGIIPIIAHPERYIYVQENPKIVEDYIKAGCLIQCNYGSMLNIYGNTSKETLKILLKENLVHFIATDTHDSKKMYQKITKVEKRIERIIGEEKFKKISKINPQKILNNDDLD